jgi:hypothetical protein
MQARHTAALFLKNNVITAARQVPGEQTNVALDVEYVKVCTLSMLQSTVRPLRQAAGTLAASVLTAHPLAMWPDLVRNHDNSCVRSDSSCLFCPRVSRSEALCLQMATPRLCWLPLGAPWGFDTSE